jgi:predicted nucleic acid-binding protein
VAIVGAPPAGASRAAGDSSRYELLDPGLVRGSAEDRHLRGWLREGEPIGISSIVWTEFLCGPVRPQEIERANRIFGEPAPFDAQDAITAADLFNQSGRRRGSLLDCMIAATALRRKASLATATARILAGWRQPSSSFSPDRQPLARVRRRLRGRAS